jgi:hypothetical protein
VSPLVATVDYVISSGAVNSAIVVQNDVTSLTLTIQATGAGCVLTGLKVRATAYLVDNEYDVENSTDTSDSQEHYGPKGRDFTGRREIDPNVAISICDTAVQRYSEPRSVNHFALIGITGEYIRQGLVRQISDRIHYTEPQTGQDIDAWIESKEYRAIDGLLTVVLGCERTLDQNYARYDTAIYGTGVYGQ